MILRRVGVWSAAKLFCALYAAMGLVFGAVVTMIAVAGAMFGFGGQQAASGPGGILFGMGAVVALPIIYGVMGLLGGAIAAALYNLGARWIGGLELDLEARP